MSQETRTLILLVAALVVLLFVVVVLFIGLFSPFWCDIPVVNFISCTTGKAEIEEPQVSIQEQKKPTQTIEVVVQETETPIEIVPTPPYEDLEKAREEDPTLELFVQSLKKAIEEADFVTLETLVSETFNIGGYASEYNELSRNEFIEILKNEIAPGKITVDLTNEGRRVAQEAYVTPREGKFALLSTGWPEKAILGITRIGEEYFWTDLVIDVP